MNCSNRQLDMFLELLIAGEKNTEESIHLIASENVLSPLAKAPFLLDLSSRYYLEDIRRFGTWSFPSGKNIGMIEDQILIPSLKEVFAAEYINVRPISGMNCMLIALAALTQPGDSIFTISPQNGGHFSTEIIARRLNLNLLYIPFLNPYDIHLAYFEQLLIETQPKLIYIDQSNVLFPLDPKPIRDLVDHVSPQTIIHYDSSHINGLIVGKAIFNPLNNGAHIVGGSTHKTLPGPHKGFLATNDARIAEDIQMAADNFVSHHHPASSMSLAVTMLEMMNCGGEIYALQTIRNAKVFAHTLATNGFYVSGQERGYTACHQVWAYPLEDNTSSYFDRLTQMGIVTNLFKGLPGIEQPALRLSVAELTRLGAKEKDVQELARLMSELIKKPGEDSYLKKKIQSISKRLSSSQYCFPVQELNNTITSVLDRLNYIN